MHTLQATLAAVLLAGSITGALTGCHHLRGDHVTGGVLGRVVIYRNGVAFYERKARVEDGKVTVHVPRERVDDFLKSLTVVDVSTKKPVAVTIPREQSGDGGFLTMTLRTPEARSEVLLTYVTEAPAWKPSYRVVVGTGGKVMLESWAVVDNTTSEDWNQVLVGVGASSALAFRYDLWSVHTIDRDLLQGEERFAIAPPTGVSPYGGDGAGVEELASLDGSSIAGTPGDYTKNVPVPGRSYTAVLGAAAGSQVDTGTSFSGSSSAENQYVVGGVNTTSANVAPTPNAGVIRGTVTDTGSGSHLPGVTVVVTGPALGGASRTTISDESGNYAIGNLPRGSYQVAFYYASTEVKRSNVAVTANKITPVIQKLASAAAGEMIEITSRAPSVDQGTTKNVPPGNGQFGGFAHVETGSRSYSSDDTPAPPPPPSIDDQLRNIAKQLHGTKRQIAIEVHGAAGTDKATVARGATIKNKLVDIGIAANKIHVVPKLDGFELGPAARDRSGRRTGHRRTGATENRAR